MVEPYQKVYDKLEEIFRKYETAKQKEERVQTELAESLLPLILFTVSLVIYLIVRN